MAIVYMPRKTGLVFGSIVGVFCLVDGIFKKDVLEILAGSVIICFVVIDFMAYRKEKAKKS